MHKTGLFLLVALVISCISPRVIATQLTIVTEHLKPFQVVEAHNVSGLATDMVRDVLDEAHVRYQIDPHPWHISYQRAQTEVNTCIYSMVRSEEREAQFYWIGRIATLPTAFYSRADNPVTLHSINDARHYRTAVLKNDISHVYMQRNEFVEGENYYVSSHDVALFSLLDTPSRNIDLVMANELLINSRFDSNEQQKRYKKVFDIKELQLDFWLACGLKTSQYTVRRLQRIMSSTRFEGATALQKYLITKPDDYLLTADSNNTE